MSDKQKLIVVWPYRFRDFDWQRFELEFLSEYLEVHVHELIDALTACDTVTAGAAFESFLNFQVPPQGPPPSVHESTKAA